MESDLQPVAVVGGGGLMGSGIVQVVAASGVRVTALDVDDAGIERGARRVARGFERTVRGGRLTQEEADAAAARITFGTDLGLAAEAAHVIETVLEDLETKVSVLRLLDEICDGSVVFASNTSQFSISELAAATGRPDRVIGSHWFNPPAVIPLIEIVRGIETSDATLEVAASLARRYGKETIVCKRDTPGFVTSRLMALFIVEAARIVDEGIADPEDVDKACTLAFGHAMGPLDTADLSGLDTVERVADALAEAYGERFRLPATIRELIEAGHYGRKTGRGFRVYGEPA